MHAQASDPSPDRLPCPPRPSPSEPRVKDRHDPAPFLLEHPQGRSGSDHELDAEPRVGRAAGRALHDSSRGADFSRHIGALAKGQQQQNQQQGDGPRVHRVRIQLAGRTAAIIWFLHGPIAVRVAATSLALILLIPCTVPVNGNLSLPPYCTGEGRCEKAPVGNQASEGLGPTRRHERAPRERVQGPANGNRVSIIHALDREIRCIQTPSPLVPNRSARKSSHGKQSSGSKDVHVVDP